MKQIRFSVKQTKFLFKYFWWVGFVYFIGTGVLTNHIFEIFGLGDKLSFPLYECPGFFLCFIDNIPIIKNAGFFFKNPFFILAWSISFIIICVPPMWIFMNMLTFEEKKDEHSKKLIVQMKIGLNTYIGETNEKGDPHGEGQLIRPTDTPGYKTVLSCNFKNGLAHVMQ